MMGITANHYACCRYYKPLAYHDTEFESLPMLCEKVYAPADILVGI